MASTWRNVLPVLLFSFLCIPAVQSSSNREFRWELQENFTEALLVSNGEIPGSRPQVDVVGLSKDRKQLLLLELWSGSSKAFDLPLSGQLVAVSASLDYVVAVTHNSYVSIIDKTHSKVNYFYAPVESASSLIVSEQLTCIWPSYGQWTSIICVDNLSGAYEKCTAQIYEGSRAFFHPNQKWIYTMDTEVEPQSLHKYAFESVKLHGPGDPTKITCPQYLYDNPDFGTYEYGESMWFSHDGSRIFLDNSLTLASTATQGTDMEVHGSFESGQNKRYTCFSQATSAPNVILALKAAVPDEMFIYNWPFLTLNQTVSLEVSQAVQVHAVQYQEKPAYLLLGKISVEKQSHFVVYLNFLPLK